MCFLQLWTLPILCVPAKPAKCFYFHRTSVLLLSRGEQALMSACPHPDSSTRHQKPCKPQPACGLPSLTASWILPSTVETPECHVAPDREEPQGVSRPILLLLKKVGEVTTLLLRKVLFGETSEHRTKSTICYWLQTQQPRL